MGSKVSAILVNGGILPRGGVASGRVCACSLRSRLVLPNFSIFINLRYLEAAVGIFIMHPILSKLVMHNPKF